MVSCPYCQTPLTDRPAACPRCRADTSPLFESGDPVAAPRPARSPLTGTVRPGGRPAAAAPTLIVRSDSAELRFPLADGEYRLGCQSAGENHFPDIDLTKLDTAGSVSRRHVLVRVRDGRVYLVEEALTGIPEADRQRYAAGQRGKNGTTVNGARVGRVEVEVVGGATVRLGGLTALLVRA